MREIEVPGWRELKPHPAAEVVPMMTGEELARLQENIATGYDPSLPIVLYQGQILDGRNRHLVCRDQDVKPVFVEYDGDEPYSYAFRVNLVRRQLTPGQATLEVMKFAPLYEAEARERQRQAGGDKVSGDARERLSSGEDKRSTAKKRATRTDEKLGQLAGTSGTAVWRARRVIRHAPDLVEEVNKGTMTLNAASDEVTRRLEMSAPKTSKPMTSKTKQQKPPRRPRDLDLEGWEAVIDGKMEAFLDVAYALFEIREKCLYLATHGQYNRYLKERWGVPFAKGRVVMAGEGALELATRPREQD